MNLDTKHSRLYAEEAARRGERRVDFWAPVVAILGTLSAFLAGVNWNVLFSPEGAAVAGATVGFIGALVVLVRAVQAWLEKRR